MTQRLSQLFLCSFGAALLSLNAAAQSASNLLEPPPVLAPSPSPRVPVSAGPLVWQLMGDHIYAVQGSDGLYHVGYSMVFINKYKFAVTVQSIHVVNPSNDFKKTGTYKVVDLSGNDITGKVRLFSRPVTYDTDSYSKVLGPGESGQVIFDVVYQTRAAIPAQISHRVVSKTLDDNGQDVEFTVIDDPRDVNVTGPIVLGPPLRGNNWLNANGCCYQVAAHRAAFNPINGKIWQSENFAMDIVQVNRNGIGHTGDGSDVNQYPYYGADIIAAKGGKVVEIENDLPDQVPGHQLPSTLETAAGNHIIIDMGEGRYALYAHLQPHSIAVQVGDIVIDGQKLGLLGNSGSTDGPHLHFQIMDAPTALKANGLPFVFDRYILSGTVNDSVDGTGDKFGQGVPLPIRPSRLVESNTMPLALDVFSFGNR